MHLQLIIMQHKIKFLILYQLHINCNIYLNHIRYLFFNNKTK